MFNKRVMLGVLLCTAGLTSIFGFSEVFGMSWFGKSTVDASLVSYRKISGGDMNGSSHSVVVKAIDKQYALVCFSDAEWHNEDPKIVEYKTSAKLLEDIRSIFNKYGMLKLSKRPLSKEQILDGATTSYRFNFADKQSIRLGSDQEFPHKVYEGLREIGSCINKYIKEGQRLPGLVIPAGSNKEEEFPNRPFIKGQVLLYAYGYDNLSLRARLTNGTENTLLLKKSYTLNMLEPQKRTVLDELTNSTHELQSKQSNEYYLELKERLEAGRYELKLDNYRTEFEIN